MHIYKIIQALQGRFNEALGETHEYFLNLTSPE